MIGLEIVAEQRQPEAALALKGAMAGPAVAAEPAEERHDVLPELRRFRRRLRREPLINGRQCFRSRTPGRHRDQQRANHPA